MLTYVQFQVYLKISPFLWKVSGILEKITIFAKVSSTMRVSCDSTYVFLYIPTTIGQKTNPNGRQEAFIGSIEPFYKEEAKVFSILNIIMKREELLVNIFIEFFAYHFFKSNF